MLLAVLSDIHANLSAFEAVLQDTRRHRPDAYVVAGDLTGGPNPAETLEIVRSLPGWLIRGNTDTRVLEFARGNRPNEWQTNRQFGMLRWFARHVSEEELDFLAGLPEERTVALPGMAPLRLLHGSPGQPGEGLRPDGDGGELIQALELVTEDVLICGHTHEQWQWQRNGRLVLNPGAICGPLDGTIGAEYALLSWRGGRWQAELKKVQYDLAAVHEAFRESGLLDEGQPLAYAILLAHNTGRDVPLAFLLYAYGLLEKRGMESIRFIPDAIWEEATATFDWKRYS